MHINNKGQETETNNDWDSRVGWGVQVAMHEHEVDDQG